MRHVFKASRLIGLLTLLLGVMALSATGAQAEPGAFWKVQNTKISGLLPEIQAEKDSKHFTILSKVGLAKIEILCTEIKFVGAKLHELGRMTGKIHFDGCETFINGTLSAACLPRSPGAPEDLIETNALEGLLKLHAVGGGVNVDVLELKPVTGTVFVTLHLGLGSCSVGLNIDIKGVLFLDDCASELLVEKVKHLFDEAPLTSLTLGGNAMTFDGSFWAFLIGAHAGMTWSGHPA